MSTESAIGRAADGLEAVAKAIHAHDATPTLTRKQFVREAAVKIAAAALASPRSRGLESEIDNGIAVDAVKLADDIWDRTQKIANS